MSGFTSEQRKEIAQIVAEALAQVSNNNVQLPKVEIKPQPFQFKITETAQDVEKLDAIVLDELSKSFGNDAAERIVSCLQFCRACKTSGTRVFSDFRHFIPIYHWVRANSTPEDYVIYRKLLQTVSAIYRFKFNNGGQAPSTYNAIRSSVNREIACPHCGGTANNLVRRLIAEGLWK